MNCNFLIAHSHHPLRILGKLWHQNVLGLFASYPVIEQLLVEVRRGFCSVRFSFLRGITLKKHRHYIVSECLGFNVIVAYCVTWSLLITTKGQTSHFKLLPWLLLNNNMKKPSFWVNKLWKVWILFLSPSLNTMYRLAQGQIYAKIWWKSLVIVLKMKHEL